MAASLAFGSLEAGPEAPPPTAESFFRIAVLGDFSGRANRGQKEDADAIRARKGRAIDRDNFDDILARFEPALELPLPKSKKKADLSFRTLDDFNPNEIHDKVDNFLDCDSAEEKSALMNALVHHTDFKALESGWLGLDWLLRRILKGNPRIEVKVFDYSFDELRDDLGSADNLADCALHHLLVGEAGVPTEDTAWGLVIGLYAFDTTAADMELLGRLAKVARRAGGPFLADAHPRLLDSGFALAGDAKAQWGQLRGLPEASWLGLALPRFLLRLPYGERTKSIDNFVYEEFTGPRDDCYLWGSAALACASLLAMGFNKSGWSFQPGQLLDLTGMHVHSYRDDEDEEHVTLAEAWLTKPAVEKLVGLGLMPFLPVKGKDAMQTFHFCSLAQPAEKQRASDLIGRWAQEGMTSQARSAKPPVTVGVSLGADVASGRVPSAPAPAPPAGKAKKPKKEDAPADDAPSASADEAPAEEMDPELAALMAELENPAPAAEPPAEEAMDPELAALMAELEGTPAPAESAAAPPPAEEVAMDPELAALMAELEGPPAAAAPERATEEPAADDAMDPELAAMLAELEGGSAPEATPAPAEEPAAEPPADGMDPELAAMLAELEAGTAAPAEDAVTGSADAQVEVEALGGAGALEDLGWPVFVPAFVEDFARQARILREGLKNKSVEKEVAGLVKKCGGYSALAGDGITPDMGLGAQLAALRPLAQFKAMDDPELQAMARHYGANLRTAKADEDRLRLVTQLRDFDKWASDARNQDTVAALEGTKFAERRQVQMEQEFAKLGGEAAFDDWIDAHPLDADAGASLEAKVSLLRGLREFTRLGGEEAYLREAAGATAMVDTLSGMLEKLKAMRAAQE